MLNQMLNLLITMGYQRVRLNVEEIQLYCKTMQDKNLFVFVTDTPLTRSQTNDSLAGTINQLDRKLREKNQQSEFLSIIITPQVEMVRELAQLNSSVWFVDMMNKKLVIFENQYADYKELRQHVEQLLDTTNVIENSPKDVSVNWKIKIKSLPLCCCSIVIINIIIFLLMDLVLSSQQSNLIIERFGELWTAIKNQGEYYRLFTCMFLHYGMNHLFNNMVVLYFAGSCLERILKPTKFLVVYFGGGLIAGVVSMSYNMIYSRYIISVGASGAIFALIGAMLYIVLINKGHLNGVSTRQMLLFVAFSLYGGFASSNVDNAAHIGGFIAGALIAVLLYRKPKARYDQ